MCTSHIKKVMSNLISNLYGLKTITTSVHAFLNLVKLWKMLFVIKSDSFSNVD